MKKGKKCQVSSVKCRGKGRQTLPAERDIVIEVEESRNPLLADCPFVARAVHRLTDHVLYQSAYHATEADATADVEGWIAASTLAGKTRVSPPVNTPGARSMASETPVCSRGTKGGKA